MTGIKSEDFDKRSLAHAETLTGYEAMWARREVGLCIMCSTPLEERSYSTPESNPLVGPGGGTPKHWKLHYAVCPKCGILYETVLILPTRRQEER